MSWNLLENINHERVVDLGILLHPYCIYTAHNYTFKEMKLLEREPFRYCRYDGKVTFTRLFLMLDKVTFDEHVNILER